MNHAMIEARRERALEPAWNPAWLRLLLLAQYTLFGTTIGLQGVMWSDVKLALGLSEGLFGTAMMLTPLVGFGILVSSRRWQHIGPRRSAIAGLLAIAGALLALAAAPTLGALLAARGLAGLGFALIESAVNNAALSWEQWTGRGMFSTLYALFSAGMVAGALAGGALLGAGLSYREALLLLAPLILLAAGATGLTGYPPERATRAAAPDPQPGALVWRGSLLALATICLFGVAGEALATLWSVIYLRSLGAGALAGSVTFALFNGAMIGGRLLNETIIARWGTRAAIRLAGAGVAGAAALLATGGLAASVAAFGLLGLAVAGVVPTALTAARATHSGAATVNGIVATTYLGFVVAPPLTGWLAELCGLQPALLLILAVIAVIMLWLARRL